LAQKQSAFMPLSLRVRNSCRTTWLGGDFRYRPSKHMQIEENRRSLHSAALRSR
jgi:hypothetical protein